MNTPEFINKIDWTSLRSQKAMLLGIIQAANLGAIVNRELEGILALVDATQDYAVDELGIPEMLVFDFELEDKREENVPEVSKTLWLCSHCGSDNVQYKAWVNANSNEILDGDVDGDEDGYCNDCETYGELITAEIRANRKIVGYQVRNDEGEIHPLMETSSSLYNLSQAREMLSDLPGMNVFNEWKLLAIWTGDVEEPTMMFEGDPRD